MPLDKSCAIDAVSRNVSTEMKDGGKPQSQAVAIALSTLRRACGVPDDGKKMSAKAIVAAGSKKESKTFVRLAALIEREPEPDYEPLAFLIDLANVSERARAEAAEWKRGPHTEELLDMVDRFMKRRTQVPTFEDTGERNPGSEEWLGWVTRVSLAADNMAGDELSALLKSYAEGKVRVPGDPEPIFEKLGNSLDFAVRSSQHGVGTSPSASRLPSDPYTSYESGGAIVSGDGRAPAMPKKKSKKR